MLLSLTCGNYETERFRSLCRFFKFHINFLMLIAAIVECFPVAFREKVTPSDFLSHRSV